MDRRHVLLATVLSAGGASSPVYLLRDDFTDTVAAGSVNATAATPGPGTRVAVDTNSKISVGSGVLNFATGAAANDGYWLDLVTRAAGRLLMATIVPADTAGKIAFGWDANQTGAILDHLVFNTTTGIQIVSNGGTAYLVGSYSAGSYQVAAIMKTTGIYYFIKGGAYSEWELLMITRIGTGNAYPAVQAQNASSVFTADAVLYPESTNLPTPICFDSFTRANGAIGTSEALGPDQQACTARTWTGGTWTIATNKAINTPAEVTNLVTDGGLENWSDTTHLVSWAENLVGGSTINQDTSEKHGGSSSARMDIDASNNHAYIENTAITKAVGNWMKCKWWGRASAADKTFKVLNNYMTVVTSATRNPGTTWTQFTDTNLIKFANPIWSFVKDAMTSASFWVDDVEIYALSTPELFASVTDAATANVTGCVDIVNNLGTQAGMVFCLDSTTDPKNFILVYTAITSASRQIIIDKCVNGTYSYGLRITGLPTNYDGKLTVILRTVAGTMTVSPFFTQSGVTIAAGAPITLTDAGIIGNTKHGLFSTDAGNTFANYELFPTGTGGEHTFIESFFSVRTVRGLFYLGDSKTINLGWEPLLQESLNAATEGAYSWIEQPLMIANALWTSDYLNFYVQERVPTENKTADYVLVNIGANDMGVTSEADFKADLTEIINTIHAKWASVPIYLAKPWKSGSTADANTLAGWIDDLVALNPSFVHVGPDERTWLENGDDGATYTSDGTHYSAAGYVENAAQWKAILGY